MIARNLPSGLLCLGKKPEFPRAEKRGLSGSLQDEQATRPVEWETIPQEQLLTSNFQHLTIFPR